MLLTSVKGMKVQHTLHSSFHWFDMFALVYLHINTHFKGDVIACCFSRGSCCACSQRIGFGECKVNDLIL